VRRAGRPASRRRTSPSVAFIEAVRPKIAVFQAGDRNRFGHPAPEVVARYRERSVAIVASPACGAWRWIAAGAAEGRCECDAAPRYSHYTGAAAGE